MTRTAILLVFVLGAPSSAVAQGYCAHFYDGGRSCGIPNLDMCLQTVRGVGGDCEIDNSDEIPKNLMQKLLESRDDRPPAVRGLDAMPPPPGR